MHRKIGLLGLLVLFAGIAHAGDTSIDPYSGYGVGSDRPTETLQPRREVARDAQKNDLKDVLEKQNQLYQKLLDQQASFITAVEDLKKQQEIQNKTLESIEKNQNIAFSYQRGIKEWELGKEQKGIAWLGAKSKTISQINDEAGLLDMLTNYDKDMKKRSEKIEKGDK